MSYSIQLVLVDIISQALIVITIIIITIILPQIFSLYFIVILLDTAADPRALAQHGPSITLRHPRSRE